MPIEEIVGALGEAALRALKPFLGDTGTSPRGPHEIKATINTTDLRRIKGLQGTVKVPLRMSGSIIIKGQQYSAKAKDMPIDAGTQVEVIGADGSELIVRAIETGSTGAKQNRTKR